ncbi:MULTISPECIES: hypothetical protein [unclassified Sinorhizobium]
MGFTPADVKAMSMWEFLASVDGYVRAQGGEEKMSNAEAEDLWQWLQSKE